jgi:peptide/nickel transport system permease protein
VNRQAILLFVVRRLLVLAALLAVASFAVFSLLYIAPGSPVEILLGASATQTTATVRTLTHEYHLDQPFLMQYWLWGKGVLFHLQFGTSVQTTLPVTDEIKERLPTSLFLGGYAFVLTMIVGIGGGIMAALKRRTVADRGIVGASIVALSTPAFVSGVFLLYVFAILLHVFPVYGKGSGFLDETWHLTLPAVSLALVSAAYVLKHTRSALLGVLDQDYVVFARARGLSSRRVLYAYALRNALIPVVTISGLMLAFLITGAIFVEVVFSLPGIGQLLVESATNEDLPMLQGVAMLVAVLIMGANLLADLAYLAVDPRIRLGRKSA